jgi:DNA-binding NarL/FixJ family response regulator
MAGVSVDDVRLQEVVDRLRDPNPRSRCGAGAHCRDAGRRSSGRSGPAATRSSGPRCDRELRTCGLGHRPDPAGPLTTQERAVADLVAAGRTNREAARELVVSVKTIEFHLGNVFTKLGVRSRSQLTLELLKTGEPA